VFLSSAIALPPAAVQSEVEYLLQHIKESGCEFYRNGLWYDGARASAHLRTKYRCLVARDQVSTTEEFIERAATKSTISGIPYQIRCIGSVAIDSSRWLSEALAAYRQTQVILPDR
jgi:hypothetical protein